ncbi:hypothetical protein BSK56_30375 [Paenibacillus borealis]|uniref:Secreted protein n=1 Tax=Paenibacillus borealis TaxID=160799 RepID=A0ABX3GWJ5_PAEBO|nr:hypothetical protein BSK56_30375 [Paenibacillus borealis]
MIVETSLIMLCLVLLTFYTVVQHQRSQGIFCREVFYIVLGRRTAAAGCQCQQRHKQHCGYFFQDEIQFSTPLLPGMSPFFYNI